MNTPTRPRARAVVGLAALSALVVGSFAVPAQAVALSAHAHPHPISGIVPPEDGTYHHSHSRVRHYATQHPAAPQAGAVGTTAGKTLSWQGGSTVNGQAAQGVTSATPKVYLVYWGSQWGTQGSNAQGNITLSADYAGGAPVAEALFKGLGTGGEKWSGVLTQYCDGASVAVGATSCPAGAPLVGYPNGGALAGVWYDNTSAEPVPASGTQIGNEALAAAAHFGNTTAASNRYAQYIILSAPGTNPDSYLSGNAGCAWHSDAWSSSMNTLVAFTNQPYNMDTNFCGKNFLTAGSGGTLDGYTMTLGHEYAETITDQYPNSGWINTSGGSENGDDCAWSASSAYVQMSTGSFAMQPTWSNDTNECDISHVIVGASAGNTVTVTNPGAQTGTAGTAKSVQITATDSASAALTYVATGLPAGLSINASTGLISGTPTTAGTSSVTVTAKDSTGASGSATFTFTVNPAPTQANTVSVTNPGSQTGTVGTAKSLQMHATDSSTSATLTYTATGLPAGLSINASTGLISGTPTTAASSSVTVKATDGTGAAGSTSFTWTISPKPTTTCTATQLFTNPGFESGTTGWTSSPWVINNDGYMSRTGSGYAWLDGYNAAATDTLSQKVTIPAGCKATLSYWTYIYTAHSGTAAIDTLTVTVNGTRVQHLSNANASSGYVQRTVDLSAFAGQSVTVKWTGVQAGSTTTSFFIDDTALSTSATASTRTAVSASTSGGLSWGNLASWLFTNAGL